MFCHMDRPLLPDLCLDLNAMSTNDCLGYFCFNKDQIKQICCRLPFPEVWKTPYRDRVFLVEAVCLLLRRLLYPNWWRDLEQQFGRFHPALSHIFWDFGDKLLCLVIRNVIFYPVTAEKCESYSNAFANAGAFPELNLIASLDGKKQMTCRPTNNQHTQYCRHKKGHGFKYQTLETPDELLLNCTYANNGWHGDRFIYRVSNIKEFWQNHAVLSQYRMLVDCAYPTDEVLCTVQEGDWWLFAFHAPTLQ